MELLKKYLGKVQSVDLKEAADDSLPMLLTPAAWVTWRDLAETTKTCKKRCEPIKLSSMKGLCVAKCQADEAIRRVTMLRSALTNCGRAKNPDRCREGINKQIEKWADRLRDIRIRVAKLRVKATKERM